ncbi:metallopeptidase [Hahella sp. KA22]|nr:metallopeptidase [Hahella sp. KA22]QAY57415.1 metallopeptidase [Hahella sp. KA22]
MQLSRIVLYVIAVLMLAPAAAENVRADSGWQDQGDHEKKLKELKRDISKLKDWIHDAQGEQSDLEKELRATEEKIQDKVREINKLQTSINDTEKQVDELEDKEKEHLASLSQQKGLLARQIQAAYGMGREQGVKLLLNAEDPTTLQRMLAYYDYLNVARGEHIEKYRQTIEELKQTRAEILKRNQALLESRNALALSKETLESKRKERETTLAKLNSSLNYKQNELTRMQKNQKQLETLVKEVEKAISNLELTQDSVPFSKLRAKLPKPTKGALQQLQGQSGGGFRPSGVFFQTPLNTPVSAVHHGRVVFADWLRGFGLLMIIDHGDGYMSLYGYNQALLKDTGDWVRSGETVASAGSSGGQSETGLYFEIRHNGKPDDPLRWFKK